MLLAELIGLLAAIVVGAILALLAAGCLIVLAARAVTRGAGWVLWQYTQRHPRYRHDPDQILEKVVRAEMAQLDGELRDMGSDVDTP